MALAVDGYNDDPRELVDIVRVREFLIELNQQWPYWAFFFNQVDDSIKLLSSCICGTDFPGRGAVEIDAQRLQVFLFRGFEAMNSLFDKYDYPERELELMSQGVLEVIDQAGVG
jgi:hypothetical protein